MICTNLYFLILISFHLLPFTEGSFISNIEHFFFYSMRMKVRADKARTHRVVACGIYFLRSTIKIKWACVLDRALD